MKLKILKVLTVQSFNCQYFFSFELIFAHWLLYYVFDFDDTDFTYNINKMFDS